MSWEHFKNIQIHAGVAQVNYLTPEFPIPRQILGRPGLGQLPDCFSHFTYPNVDVVDEHVIIRYLRMWSHIKEDAPDGQSVPITEWGWNCREATAEMKGESVLRVYPLGWFYE